MVPSVYNQSAQYRLVEQRYARNNQTRTHIQLRIQFCFVQVINLDSSVLCQIIFECECVSVFDYYVHIYIYIYVCVCVCVCFVCIIKEVGFQGISYKRIFIFINTYNIISCCYGTQVNILL